MREDKILLEQAQRELKASSESNAFEKILHKYERLIYYIARRYFANHEDVMDASQETAIKIYNGLPQLVLPDFPSDGSLTDGSSPDGSSPGGSMKAWICTITARVCLDALRKRRVQTSELTEAVYAEESVTAPLPSAEESAAANERVAEILSAIKKLPEDHRMAIILRDMQGLSYEEIATALQISIGTVKSRLSRARGGLKKLLKS
ncbi:MAG: RNA polymerase sigma factor [Defluviitaleaceae bacterium]|nr:RNA polymerase sigma factor [Defluviitaleaceae bacterium]